MISPSDFLGRWTIARDIDDLRSGGIAHFAGIASIEQTNEDWVYTEAGTLDLSTNVQMHAERKYFWRPHTAGFDVFFDDKRFFHSFDLGVSAQATHWCDPDDYKVAYDFSTWPQWQSTWQVEGPRKKYVMRNLFRPAQ